MNYHAGDAEPDSDSIQESNIRTALKRILDSAEFTRSKRAGAFLRFVVEEKLAGWKRRSVEGVLHRSRGLWA